jgi:glycosyltransferase involved in cell wall biosynthesis
MSVSFRAVFAIPGDITTLTGGYIYERSLLEGLRHLGREVRHLQAGASFPNPHPYDIADAARQLAACEPGDPVILDGFLVGEMPTASLARVTAPMVAIVHHPLALESGLDDTRRDYLYRTERANLRLMRHVIVPSPHTAMILTESYDVTSDRITVARPGTLVPRGPSVPVTPPLLLSVGIQHPRKGHDVLLAALSLLQHLEWQAVIVGSPYDSSHVAELSHLHATLGLSDRVRLAGRVDADELSRLYRSASVFALATRYEGYGIVFDEALAHGLPIVSCAVGAVPDTVPHDAGMLVAPDNPAAFATALDALLTDDTHRRSLATAATRVGANLPRWSDTAALVAQVLDHVQR